MRTPTWKQIAWVGCCVLALGLGARGEPSMLDSPGSTAAAVGTGKGGTITTDEVADFSNVEIMDESLKGKLLVQRISSNRGANNLLAVSATLKSNAGKKFNFEVETIYKDRAGRELNSGSWMKFTLKGREETEYKSSAINVEAVSFVIRVRKPAMTGTASTAN